MSDELNNLPDRMFGSLKEPPDGERLAQIARQLGSSLDPIRPLPSRTAIVLLVLGGFVLFTVAAALPFGYFGFHQLDFLARALYCLSILVAGALFAIALDQELVPGSKRYFAPALLISAVFAVLCVLVAALFPKFAMEHFVASGIPCLRLGTICAMVFGVLLTVWLRRGYSVSHVRAGAVAGSLAGLSGFAVLVLHCSVQNAGHILLWHFGAVVIAFGGGMLIGLWRAHSRATQ